MAKFEVAAVFSNHMVLQREKNITVFGYADKGIAIEVQLLDKDEKLLCKNTGCTNGKKWEVQLCPQKAQDGCKLLVNSGCGINFVFEDISIGEVWLAGGQSNMEFELQNCVEGPAELADKNEPNVRFYYTNKIAWKDESFYTAEKNTGWQTWESEWKKSWSAVGFLFAKKLAKDLGCTVGVIGCNWGGTSASAWMRKEYLEKDDELRSYLIEQEEATKGKTVEEQCAEYDAYVKENDEWQQKCNELYATVPGITWEQVQERIGVCKWPGPKSCKNPYRPTGLYDCMLSRILPYTIKGVIWYQGESDDHKSGMYYKLFTTMIDNWRTDWKDNQLPFVFVQLPNHRYQQDRDFKHWCFVREAQEKTHQTIKNAWMTCALDLGKYNDIHPTSKLDVSHRMEAIALAEVYGKKSEKTVHSATLKSSMIAENKIILTFDNADGFVYKKDEVRLAEYKALEEIQKNVVPEDFTGFEIAGEDGNYVPAKYEFTSDNTITLCSDLVKTPKFARYAWFNYGPVSIYCKSGLPLAPFRTSIDDLQAATEHADIQQIMTV